MNKTTVAWIVIIILIILVAGGYFYSISSMQSSPASQIPSTSTAQQEAASQNGNLMLGINSSSSLGQFLVADNAMTLYTYAKDTTGTTTCYGQCAANWPPYTIPAGSALNAQSGVTGAIGTIVRADGTTQLTYNGLPLYFYTGDQSPNDTTGQGIGGVWSVVKP